MDSGLALGQQLSDLAVIVRIQLLTSPGQKLIFERIQQEGHPSLNIMRTEKGTYVISKTQGSRCRPWLHTTAYQGLQPFPWLTVEAAYVSEVHSSWKYIYYPFPGQFKDGCVPMFDQFSLTLGCHRGSEAKNPLRL